jgi:hypothetical protein
MISLMACYVFWKGINSPTEEVLDPLLTEDVDVKTKMGEGKKRYVDRRQSSFERNFKRL